MCAEMSEEVCPPASKILLFFFNDTATTEIYTLSLHDALPISRLLPGVQFSANLGDLLEAMPVVRILLNSILDRKSTRLNSSHANISYAVFCLTNNNYPPSPSSC